MNPRDLSERVRFIVAGGPVTEAVVVRCSLCGSPLFTTTDPRPSDAYARCFDCDRMTGG